MAQLRTIVIYYAAAALICILIGEHYYGAGAVPSGSDNAAAAATNGQPNQGISTRTSRHTTGDGNTIWTGIGNVVTDGLSGLPSAPFSVKEITYLVKWKSGGTKWSPVLDPIVDMKSHWNKDADAATKILVHGFTPVKELVPLDRLKSYNIADIANAYFAKDKNANILIMDWTSLSTHSYLKYTEAALSVPNAAKDLADMIVYLHSTLNLIPNLEKVHLIGFSLGAHVAGGAGFRVFRKLNKTVGRISGIDPAGAQFHMNRELPSVKDNVLDPSDASFVDVIHCNMGAYFVGSRVPEFNFDFGHYGTPAQSGHVDFYPEGGITQTGCSYWKDKSGCSHGKCPGIFLRTIKDPPKVACPCKDWDTYKAGKCKCDVTTGGAYFGDPVNKKSRGKFYLKFP